MTSNRWSQVEHLYHAALALAPGDRAAYLGAQCAGDAALRREVEWLLAQEVSRERLLDTPAVVLAAQLVTVAGDAPASWVGRTLGPYRILDRLGAGGMGEVYRAHDSNLGRQVAIKVLGPDVTADHERLARFEREARLLATLNHPHIAAIYALEIHDGVPALILELVPGDTLADRIARGPLPVRTVLAYARAIAEALDAAHGTGIIHRDLKPANIQVTPEGVVKVLDFGLAKAHGPETGEHSQAPTATLGGTRPGVVMGTAAYMSPEQARGLRVDKRTDIWAFGCVVYEMLAGRTAFAGGTVSDTIAAILEREPDWTALPAATPTSLVRLVQRCLAKDLKQRLRDIGDAPVDLDVAAGPAPLTPAARAPWKRVIIPGVGVVVVAILAALAGRSLHPSSLSPRPVQFVIAPPEGAQLGVVAPVPSPDGTQIAFTVRSASGQRTLWTREIGLTTAREVAGTEDVINLPFWSPDSRSLGFFAQGKLKRVTLAGGPPLTISTIQDNLGATWNRDNVIVFAPVNRTVLHKVAASGGTPEPITTLNADRNENSHRWPHFLPDGRHFLFTARSDVIENTLIYVGSLDSKDVKPLLAAQSNGAYSSGYLLFARESNLMAQRFDPATLTLSGEAVPVASSVVHNTTGSNAAFGASTNGTALAYQAGVGPLVNLTWFDRTGTKLGTIGEQNRFSEIRLSPDGSSAAVVVPDPDSGNRDIWLMDLRSGVMTRFTSNPANDWQVAWSPDSRRIAFASDRNGRSSVYIKPIDGGSEELLIHLPDRGIFPKDWSKDGSVLALNIDSQAGVPSLAAMRLAGDRTPFAVGGGIAQRENELTLTHDARFGAFESRESGSDEIYVVPFPTGRRRRVSVAGGRLPRWKADDSELYYRSPDGAIMAVPFDGKDPIEPGTPVRLLVPCSGVALNPASYLYGVTAEGSRFLAVCPSAESSRSTIVVSLDWTASLKP